MAFRKLDKLNVQIQRELTDIIKREVRDSKLGFLTITGVEVTSDLSYAKVYVSFLGKGYEKKEGMEALNRSKGYIRTLLSKRLTTRKTPELNFVEDTSIEYGNHIETLLNEIHKKENHQD